MQGGREGEEGADLGSGRGGGHTNQGVSVTARGAHSPPVPPPSPHALLQALGQLGLVADGAGPAVQAVIVTGQAARRYLPIRAAVGHRGSAPRVPSVPPRMFCAPPSPLGLGCWLIPPAQLTAALHPRLRHQDGLWGDTETPPPPPPRTTRSPGFICPELPTQLWPILPQGDRFSLGGLCAHHPFSSLQLDIPSTYMQETSPLCLLMLHLPSWHREHLFSWHCAPSN